MDNEKREYPKVAMLQLKIWWPEFNIETYTLHPRVLPTEGMMFKMNWMEHFDKDGDDKDGQEKAKFFESNGTDGWYRVHVWGIGLDWNKSHNYIDSYTISLHTEAHYNRKYGYLPLTQKICSQ